MRLICQSVVSRAICQSLQPRVVSALVLSVAKRLATRAKVGSGQMTFAVAAAFCLANIVQHYVCIFTICVGEKVTLCQQRCTARSTNGWPPAGTKDSGVGLSSGFVAQRNRLRRNGAQRAICRKQKRLQALRLPPCLHTLCDRDRSHRKRCTNGTMSNATRDQDIQLLCTATLAAKDALPLLLLLQRTWLNNGQEKNRASKPAFRHCKGLDKCAAIFQQYADEMSFRVAHDQPTVFEKKHCKRAQQ